MSNRQEFAFASTLQLARGIAAGRAKVAVDGTFHLVTACGGIGAVDGRPATRLPETVGYDVRIDLSREVERGEEIGGQRFAGELGRGTAGLAIDDAEAGGSASLPK